MPTSRLPTIVLLLFSAACVGFPGARTGEASELGVEDFKFDGPLGCQGAKIEKLAPNHFRITVGHAPQHPEWPNMAQFQIVRHAQGNAPTIEVRSVGAKQYLIHHYSYSWSYDGRDWRPLRWQNTRSSDEGTFKFPVFEQDTVFVGHQVPMSYADVTALLDGWKQHPAVKVHVVGQSLGGRNLYRMEIADPRSPHPVAERWVHYFANQHPGEHNSQWRMVGAIEWLLSREGEDTRRRSICHFVLLMSPDAPTNGWYRVNAQGLDMNRSYSSAGSNPDQGHEPYLWQKDLESLMASDCPVSSVWSMHTWPGVADPNIALAPDLAVVLGPATRFAEILQHHDPDHKWVKPLKISEGRVKARSKPWTPPPPGKKPVPHGGGAAWNSGPGNQFGVTHVLCEGGGGQLTKAENLQSGRVLMQSLAEYFRGTKPRPREQR
jgi:hypothetical protein